MRRPTCTCRRRTVLVGGGKGSLGLLENFLEDLSRAAVSLALPSAYQKLLQLLVLAVSNGGGDSIKIKIPSTLIEPGREEISVC